MAETGRLVLSPLSHTWILDLDGTILKHNGYLTDGKDFFLAGAKEFLDSIPEEDLIIFLTSRKKEEKKRTEEFLLGHGIHYGYIIYEAPYGERILVNDRKPSGLNTAVAVNMERDDAVRLKIVIDKAL